MIQIGIYDGGHLILDTTPYAKTASISNNATGYELLTIVLDIPTRWQYDLLGNSRVYDVIATHQHGFGVWRGRVSSRALLSSNVELVAEGDYAAYRDDVYTAFFASNRYTDWSKADGEDQAPSGQAFDPEQWEMDNNNRLYIAPTSGAAYSGNGNVGAWAFKIPDKGRNYIKRVSLDYSIRLPNSDWDFYVTGEASSGLQEVMFASAGTGSVVSGTMTSTSVLDLVVVYIMIEYSGASSTTITQETGHYYVKATNPAITYDDATVYADEVVSDVAAFMAGVNGGQANDSGVLVDSSAVHMPDAIYEDMRCDHLLAELARDVGYEVGVWDHKLLHFRSRNSDSRTYHINNSIPQMQYALRPLQNAAYTVYRDTNNVTKRTDTATDDSSVARYGLRRRYAEVTRSTSLSTAESVRDDAVVDGAAVAPRADITIERMYTPYGQRVSVSELRHGDTLVFQNLPPLLTLQENARARAVNPRLDLITGLMQVSLEFPLPSLETVLASLTE